MDTQKVLQQFGLDQKAIKVYLALLQLGKASVLNIAKKAEIKRPTAYLILDELVEKGLASKIPIKGKTTFYAENPQDLLKILEKRKIQIEKIIPDLMTIYNVKEDKPKVLMYEGEEGVMQLYEYIAQSKPKEIWWLADLETIDKRLPQTLPIFLDLVRSKKMKMRDFNGNSVFEKTYAKKNQRANYEFRQSSLPVKNIDMAFFDDKIAIISLHEDIYSVIIEDKNIAESLKSMYELAWRSGEKVNK